MSMTPREISAALQKLRTEIGPKSDTYLDISSRRSGHPISLSVYADGIGHGQTFSIEADEWAEAFTLANEKWGEVKERVWAEAVEKMALEIIRVTATKGECCGHDLRSAKFSQEEIDRYGAMACAKANEMADSGPFSLTPSAKANAA